jgi:hypothetical protein
MSIAENLILPGFSAHVQKTKCYNKSSNGKGYLRLDSVGSLPRAMPDLVEIDSRLWNCRKNKQTLFFM